MFATYIQTLWNIEKIPCLRNNPEVAEEINTDNIH